MFIQLLLWFLSLNPGPLFALFLSILLSPILIRTRICIACNGHFIFKNPAKSISCSTVSFCLPPLSHSLSLSLSLSLTLTLSHHSLSPSFPPFFFLLPPRSPRLFMSVCPSECLPTSIPLSLPLYLSISPSLKMII